ncbi:MAG: aminotransferase class III-fold pyridoxal phosphate-dependent enzyme, partial [Cloacibacillus evryensis]
MEGPEAPAKGKSPRRIQRTQGHEDHALQRSLPRRSGYTLSVTNTNDQHQRFAKFTDWRASTRRSPSRLKTISERSVARGPGHQADQTGADGSRRVAAVIIETIQGEGGDNHFRTEFFQKLRQICDENEMLLIFDEVQCGMGITGKMWAWEHHAPVKPDLFSFGKKAQICGLIAGPRVDEVKDNCFKVSSRINSTWGGTVVD